MVVQFSKWGNSLAVRLPNSLVKELFLSEGSKAELLAENGRLVLTPVRNTPSFVLEDLLAGITEENLHTEIKTGRAVGNEFA